MRGSHPHPQTTPTANLGRHHSGFDRNVETRADFFPARPSTNRSRLGRLIFALLAAITTCTHPEVATSQERSLTDASSTFADRTATASAFASFLDTPATQLVALDLGDRRGAVQAAVREVYRRTGDRPLWIAANGPTPRARTAIERLRSAHKDGLLPDAYRTDELNALVEDATRSAATDDAHRFAIDRGLTEALVLHGMDLAHGRVDPAEMSWFVERELVDVAEILSSAILAVQDDLGAERLAPPFSEYSALRERLAHYRAVDAAGGWQTVPDGDKLDVGDLADRRRLAALERRLLADGDLVDGTSEHGGDGAASEPGDLDTYDARLADGVRRFQRRHGLGADGIVGPRTMRELNTSARQRVEQIEVNLERWRWMPRSIAARHLRVNVPAFELALYDREQGPIDRMAVIVGRRDWPTPVFADEVRFIVLNPYWNVPQSIAKSELLPKVRRDPSFLTREGYELLDARGQPVELDPNEPPRLSHRTHFLRQLPGPGNALGRMKFLFPNPFDVYLHDTPTRHLFARAERAFSHGCVRVEHPQRLAEFLVQDDPQWSMARAERLLESGLPDRWMRLADAVPIYIVYFTASVDALGAPRFHPDIYDRDRRVADALRRLHPTVDKAAAGVRIAHAGREER